MKFLRGEEFKVFKNCCLVSNYGRVYSLMTEKFVKPFKNRAGYSVFRIYENKVRKGYYLHITVVNLFGDKYGKKLPNCVKNGTVSMLDLDLNIDHIDRNKQNNSIENLELVTHSENMKRYWNKKLEALKSDIEELEQIFS